LLCSALACSLPPREHTWRLSLAALVPHLWVRAPHLCAQASWLQHHAAARCTLRGACI